MICLQLVNQSNTSSFLVHIQNHTLSFPFDHFHGFVKLWSAITTAGPKNISGYTRRMHPHQHRFVLIPGAFGERQVRLARIGQSKSRAEEHTAELQSLMRTSYAVFCLTKKKQTIPTKHHT